MIHMHWSDLQATRPIQDQVEKSRAHPCESQVIMQRRELRRKARRGLPREPAQAH